MPPRNYPVQPGPQSNEEAFFGGVGAAVASAEERRRQAKADKQNDALFAMKMQAVLDEMNRARLEAGAEPITFDVGASAGAGRVPGTPGFNPEADTPTTGAGATGGIMGRLRGLRAAVGAALGVETGPDYEVPTPQAMTQTGPSRGEKIAQMQTSSAERINAADNDAAMERLAVENRALMDRLGKELAGRREIAGLTHRDVASQVNAQLIAAMGDEVRDYNISIDRLNEQLKIPVAQRAQETKGGMEAARAEAARLQQQLTDLVRARNARVLQRQQLIDATGGIRAVQPPPETGAAPDQSAAELNQAAEAIRAVMQDPSLSEEQKNAKITRIQQLYMQRTGRSL